MVPVIPAQNGRFEVQDQPELQRKTLSFKKKKKAGEKLMKVNFGEINFVKNNLDQALKLCKLCVGVWV